MKSASLIVLWVLCFSPCLASANPGQVENLAKMAENAPGEPSSNTTSAEARLSADQMAHEFQVLREEHKMDEVIALCILAFVSLITVLYFLAKKEDQPGLHIVHATGLIFITFGTIVLVVMAETEQQLTAAIGILGGIAGYLFGSMKSREPAGKKDNAGRAAS